MVAKPDFFNQTPENRSKAVRLAVGIFHGIAAQPADKKNRGHFAAEGFWFGHECTDLLPVRIGHPIVGDLRIFELFSFA
jgi:hypothetical protein